MDGSQVGGEQFFGDPEKVLSLIDRRIVPEGPWPWTDDTIMAVSIVQVVSAPDARYTEVPAAFVQLKDGETATEDELIAHCLGKIATFKVPRYVRFVDDWPMSGTKVQKYRLRETIAAELEAAGVTEAPRLDSGAAR